MGFFANLAFTTNQVVINLDNDHCSCGSLLIHCSPRVSICCSLDSGSRSSSQPTSISGRTEAHTKQYTLSRSPLQQAQHGLHNTAGGLSANKVPGVGYVAIAQPPTLLDDSATPSLTDSAAAPPPPFGWKLPQPTIRAFRLNLAASFEGGFTVNPALPGTTVTPGRRRYSAASWPFFSSPPRSLKGRDLIAQRRNPFWEHRRSNPSSLAGVGNSSLSSTPLLCNSL